VSSGVPSPIAMQDLTASADYVDRGSMHRAGFRGGRVGLRGGALENTGRPIWQVPCFHSDRCEPDGQGAQIEVTSGVPSPIAIQDLAASADFVDRGSVRRAGFRGGRVGPRGGTLENTGRPIWQVIVFHSDRCELGGQGTRIEVTSGVPSPIAIQDLAASADFVDKGSVRRAGFRGGRGGVRGGTHENTGRPIWQVPCFHSDRCESGGHGTRIEVSSGLPNPIAMQGLESFRNYHKPSRTRGTRLLRCPG
jgi:hypothetical protein